MTVLVIGIGNDLRSDDGAGRAVADRLAELGLPGVTVRSVVQLTPELALDLATADVVVFVDADRAVGAVTTSAVTPVEVAEPAHRPGRRSTHHLTPGALLSLAATVGDVPSSAHLVSVPAPDLGLGDELSPVAATAAEQAVELVRRRWAT